LEGYFCFKVEYFVGLIVESGLDRQTTMTLVEVTDLKGLEALNLK
jgi:hypothetical protein